MWVNSKNKLFSESKASIIKSFLSAHPDPDVLFVPETPDNLIVPYNSFQVIIPCRVSHPAIPVILKSVSTGEKISDFHVGHTGFIHSVPPGQYQCETTVKDKTFTSAIYTVKDEGKLRWAAVL